MSRAAKIHEAIARKMTESFPGPIREALISGPAFRKEYGITVDAVLSFGKSRVAFQRSALLDAVRRTFRTRKNKSSVKDQAGQSWTVEFDKDAKPAHILLSRHKQRIVIKSFLLLSPGKTLRLNAFRQEADRVGLPEQDRKTWEDLLATRAPDDDEHAAIQEDLNATPIAVQNGIRESLVEGSVSLHTVIPHSSTYYERLIGACRDGENFDTYIANGLRRKVQALMAWNPVRGYRQSLLLAAQPAINLEVAASAPPQVQRVKVWDELARTGDVLSLAVAIEAGLEQAQAVPLLREPLGRLIEAAVAAAPVAKVDPYELLSSLIILSYGEIAYSRLLAAKPPYWRRLAAIAHAAMMASCIAEVGGDATQFIDWAKSARAQIFLLQCFVDNREEPRWMAEMILPGQLKNELGGRIWSAAHAHIAFVEECGWKGLLLDEVPGSLRSQLNLLQCFLPGPLEGASKAAIDIPADHLADIRADLAQPLPAATSFSAVANAALLFRIPDDVVDLAADALARANYYLQRGDGQPLIPFLLGLATVAAVTRSHKLADAVCTLLRNYRRFYPSELDVDATFRVALMACGSRSLLSEWCACVGNCMTDLAFQELTQEEAVRLHSHVLILCHLVPELWATCGQAEAALQALISR